VLAEQSGQQAILRRSAENGEYVRAFIVRWPQSSHYVGTSYSAEEERPLVLPRDQEMLWGGRRGNGNLVTPVKLVEIQY